MHTKLADSYVGLDSHLALWDWNVKDKVLKSGVQFVPGGSFLHYYYHSTLTAYTLIQGVGQTIDSTHIISRIDL